MTTISEAGRRPKGLYIHIPFCVKRCSYCDFLTFQDLGKKEIADYMGALTSQIRSFSAGKYLIDTIYIGGGTPSFVDGAYISKIMEEVGKAFHLTENPEITIEANPESITEDKLGSYLTAGVNRLSMGLQSMDNELLRMLGRAHSKEVFLEKYRMARDLGFENISLDLIFALPGQSLQTWEDSLRQVIGLGPEHISFYALQIEEGTPLKSMIEKRELKPVGEEEDRAMYHRALELLKGGGYEHYEISNCSKPGFRSRHNLKYWSMEEYIGIGLGAHSYYGGSRYENVSDFHTYTGCRPEDFTAHIHKNTAEDEIGEFMFTGLRKVEGIITADFEERFGQKPGIFFKEAIEKNVKAGLLQADENNIKLSCKGMDLFNQVLVDFV